MISSDTHLQIDAGEVWLSHYMLWVLDVEQIANGHLCAFSRCCSQPQDNGVLREGLLARSILSGVKSQLFSDHVVNFEVGRPKVVRPLTCAMDLIDTDHRNLSVKARKVLDEKALRGDEQHFDALLRHGLNYLTLHLVRLLRVQSRTWDI